jgi:glycosyltransferase involved in cell wall biosynthesis
VHPPVDICIITQLHPSQNPRLVKDADALTAAGYSVAVIAPDFMAWAREADREFDERAWRIVERPQFGPLSPRLTRVGELGRRLAANFAVRHLGIEHPAVVRAAHHPVAPALVRAAIRQKARLYLAHLTPALPAAAIAAEHHGVPYAFDAEDFHPGDLPNTPEHAHANMLLREIESNYLHRCTYITAASPGIADAYARTYNITKPVVVLNTFPRSRAPANFSPAGSAQPGPSLYWFSQTIGPNRGIEAAIAAISLSDAKPHLYLRGSISNGFRDELMDRARALKVPDRIHFLMPENPSTMERMAAAYDVGFSGEPGHTINNTIALGNKLFSYLLAGIPMLLSSTPAHTAFIGELGESAKLYAVDDPAEMAAALDTWLLDADRLATARSAAWSLGQSRFNWETEAGKVVASVSNVIGSPKVSVASRTHEQRLVS